MVRILNSLPYTNTIFSLYITRLSSHLVEISRISIIYSKLVNPHNFKMPINNLDKPITYSMSNISFPYQCEISHKR